MALDEQLSVELASRSNPGPGQVHNHDAVGSLRNTLGDFIVLADGVGPAKVAAQASRLVVDAVVDFYRRWNGQSPRKMLIEAIGMANATIRQHAERNPELAGMTSTVVLLHHHEGAIRIAHVGNSRVYRLRGSVIDLLTSDHTEAQRLAETGQMPEQPRVDDLRSKVLYRAVGNAAVIDVDISDAHFIEPGDAYLLCTDGLTDQLTDAEIGRQLVGKNPSQAADGLLHAVQTAGGKDAVSLAVLKFDQPPREVKHFTKGLAGPPAIHRATPRRTLPQLEWYRLNLWWKVRLAALALLVVWFLLLLLLWWAFDLGEITLFNHLGGAATLVLARPARDPDALKPRHDVSSNPNRRREVR